MERILIIDDEKNIRESLAMILEDAGYSIQRAKDGDEALQMLSDVSLVLLDIRLPNKNGIEVLKEIVSVRKDLSVIMISGQGTLQLIDEALKIGAIDFIEKPLVKSKILTSVRNTLELKRLQEENKNLREENKNLWQMIEKKYEMKGKSASIEAISKKIFRGAPTDLCVLIKGEKGTGKELSARTIHQNSMRKGMPFTVINCDATHSDMIEKELFGCKEETGKLELTNGGTLLLEEIEKIPLNVQAKITNVIQEGKLQRIEGNEDIQVDVRVIGTTTKNPENEVKKKRLEPSFYHCLKEITLTVSPLRERKDDIHILVEHFLKELCEKQGKKVISKEALDLLVEYDYPENVSELKKIITLLVERTKGEMIMAPKVSSVIKEVTTHKL